jgi:hypothetical protein
MMPFVPTAQPFPPLGKLVLRRVGPVVPVPTADCIGCESNNHTSLVVRVVEWRIVPFPPTIHPSLVLTN